MALLLRATAPEGDGALTQLCYLPRELQVPQSFQQCMVLWIFFKMAQLMVGICPLASYKRECLRREPIHPSVSWTAVLLLLFLFWRLILLLRLVLLLRLLLLLPLLLLQQVALPLLLPLLLRV